MNKKHIPNVLSIGRILLSFALIFFFRNPYVFIPLYLFIGLTDVLDGYLARKLKAESAFGAKLDSISDFIFYTIFTAYLLVVYSEILLVYWIPIILIFIVRMGNIAIGFLRHKKLVMIHTIANKITGILVFISPIILIIGLKKYIILVIIMAFLASIEELIIIFKCRKGQINLNKKHL